MSSSALSRRDFLVTLAAAGALAACSKGAGVGRSQPLVVAVGPAYAPKDARALEAAWSKGSGLTLDVQVKRDVGEVIDAIQAGRAHAGLVSLFDYLYCAEVFGVLPVAQIVRADGQTSQSGELVVKAGAKVDGLRALAGKKVGYVDPASVTGFLLPAARLREEGVTCEAVFLGSHDAVLDAVASGAVFAGATYAGHSKTKPGLEALAQTGSLPNEPLFVASTVPADVRDALAKGVAAKAPAGALDGIADASSFRIVDAKEYATAAGRVRAAGRAVEDLVPDGWRRANENRRPMWSYGP